jgi:protein-disulfide isomerase
MGWQLHEFIFENQETFHGLGTQNETDKKLCELLKENCETVKTCAGSEEAANWVKTASKEGSDAEVTGTPTVYVNGKKLDGGANLMVLKSLYKELNL